jgi:hypothetical protein
MVRESEENLGIVSTYYTFISSAIIDHISKIDFSTSADVLPWRRFNIALPALVCSLIVAFCIYRPNHEDSRIHLTSTLPSVSLESFEVQRDPLPSLTTLQYLQSIHSGGNEVSRSANVADN